MENKRIPSCDIEKFSVFIYGPFVYYIIFKINIDYCISLNLFNWFIRLMDTGYSMKCELNICVRFRYILVSKWWNVYINNCPARCNTKQSIFLQVHSACFECQPHPSSGVHKSVTTASGTVQLPPSNVAKWPRCTSTGDCIYSFVYSWWWVWLTPETCRVNLQNNKQTALCCISLDSY